MTAELWDLEPETLAPLSKRFATAEYRATAANPPRRAKITGAKPGTPCDECAAYQHETHGAFGPRMAPRIRRSIPGGPALRLCSRHGEAWKERDEADLPPKPTRNRRGRR